jgi:hypothetical protein
MHVRTLSCLAAGAFLLLATVNDVAAQQQVSGGGYAYFIRDASPIELPDGRTVLRYSDKGFLSADDPDNPFHLVNFDCAGAVAMAAGGESGVMAGTCSGVDGDGDVYTLWWKGDDLTGGTWGLMNGSGKFEGIEGGGTFSTGLNWTDGKLINRWDGEWTMK